MLMQVWWKFHSAIVRFFYESDHCEILRMARLLYCRGMCQFCNDMVPNDGVTRKLNIFPPICIKMENRSWNGPLAQHWFGQWLVSCLAQAITRTTVDSTVVGILAFTWVMGDPQCSLFNKFVLGYTDLGFFFSKTLFQSCRKISV